MGAKAWDRGSGSGVAEEWEQENGGRIRMIVVTCWEMNWKRIGGFDDREGSGWGYDRGPSGCSGDIGRRGIGSDNAQGNGRSDMLGGSAGGCMGEGLGSCLWSTKTLLVGGHVLHQTSGGRKRPRCWRCEWIGW